ncbi:MAG: 16S rRNA (cytosine(967)-C(5))-methyltransferase RsmB [Halioglobus sp.]|nr:16S rRNA (cytosine(967)-C(5))-methyltransferase RsmB [Halioglobus sp.]
MTANTRAVAAQVIAAVLQGQSLSQALPPGLDRVAAADRGLLQQLCYGTLRDAPRLQALLARLLDKPLRKRDIDVQALLLLGLYQLEGSRIPDHAAVATTVDASRQMQKTWAGGLTNAILRRFLRERDTLLTTLTAAEASAHPGWLLARLEAQWPQRAAGIIAANNSQPPMTLRVNARLTTRADYLQELAAAGIEARAGLLAPQAVYLDAGIDVHALPGFTEGRVSVQDEAAQLAAVLLGSQPGERVLDACAAPGGKACHLLELQPGIAELVAMDIDAERLARVRENLGRLKLAAHCIQGDGRQPPDSLANAIFDRILVDAPCSASGVIRRHPDIKLLRREADIAQLQRQQIEILQGLWPLLRPGGVLLYVTCSLLEDENARVIDSFLDRRDSRELEERLEHAGRPQSLPLAVTWGEPAGCGRQLLPETDGSDGMFFALLQKPR